MNKYVSFYNKNGYCIFPNFLTNHNYILSNVCKTLDGFFFKKKTDDNLDKILKKISKKRENIEIFSNFYLGLFQRQTEIYSHMFNDELLKIISELNIKIPYIASDPLLMISGGVGGNLLKEITNSPIHQDWHSMQSSINSLVCWIPLTCYGKDNYSTIGIWEGSHKNGLAKTKNGKWFATIEERNISKKFKYVEINGNPGDLIIFSSLLIHKTVNNEYGNTRITCQFRYGDLSDPILIKNKAHFNYNHCVPLTKSDAGHLKEIPRSVLKKI
jgi:hypothetical protein